MQKEWYVVNTYSGHENKVKEKLEMRASTMGMEDYIYRVVVPEQKEVEVKDGETKEKVKKMFPGYILVEMVMSDEAWFIVRNTPGVTGFIGSSGRGAKPFPLTPQEVDKILGSMGMSRLEIGNELNVDDMVKVISGPFSGMFGKVKKINMENQEIEVALDLFGQETIVELKLTEIERA
ncbi:MAG TPA: transcription termination/antitermination protein NusG [Candidatus Fimihabitans intestinipullorum]|uniref:Transcription termination/antitermination protein NusG n=1 Tax=Candidatus Fimihabitans intestinipullorum TaxID=2840820 RepID=A0A9D1HX20_9BACT|nr:transcription termination/antitermination protein NusG [Candidatus Fimihabitans intestinipullorum]